MALMVDGMPCGLCDAPMVDGQSRFGTWGVWLPSSDRLQRYCDTAFHWDCYANWEHRNRFARSYFDFWVEYEKRNPCWWRAFLDTEVLVTVNPQQGVESAWVELAETGSRINVPLAIWEIWIHETTSGSHPIEGGTIECAKAKLRNERPTRQALLESVNWNSKTELFQHLAQVEARRAEEDARRHQEIAEYNKLCDEVLPVILNSKYRCPSCRQKSGGFRLSSCKSQKSLIICRQCGHVVDPQLFATSIPRADQRLTHFGETERG